MSEQASGENKKYGCAPLGCLIIVIAIAVVIFYFLIKHSNLNMVCTAFNISIFSVYKCIN